MDISGLSLKELDNLQKQIVDEINKRKQSGKSDALKLARKAAEEAGYTLEELLGATATASKRTSKPVAIKYRHPQQTQLTWTGRGKTPRWVSAWKDANGSLDGIKVS
jgi:DNA-binding protein H-NS